MKTNTLRIRFWGLVAATLVICFQSASAGRGPKLDSAPDYTKGEKPASKGTIWAIGPTGAHGFFYYNDARQVLISEFNSIDKGSPAEGNLREGDVILGILSPTTGQDVGNGKFTFDARRSMAIAIEEAEKEAHGGKLVLNVWRPKGKVTSQMRTPPGERKRKRNSEGELVKNLEEQRTFHPDKPLSGEIMPVTLTLPVMGSYSATSPYECEKNEVLVKKLTANILKNGFASSMGGVFEALGLLATGDEAHLPRLQNYARRLAGEYAKLDARKGGGPKTWYAGYNNLFLCEYYLITKDEKVLPGIKGVSMYLAEGSSGVGTWSHGIAYVEMNGMYSHASGYGAMNQISMVCAMSLMLAQKCGIEDPAIDKAVRLALDFTRYYVDKGCIPYGDHAPTYQHDNNGKMSIAAVLYDLAGDKKEAEYFTKMSLASYQTREGGHTGHFFAWNWGGLAAARGGPEAAASFMKNTRYFLELERRHDGGSQYQPQLPQQSGKTVGFITTGQRLIQYCLPRKALYITGKGGTCVSPITGDELKAVVHAPSFNPKQHSTEVLLEALGFWSLLVRRDAAIELGKRDENVVDELIAMLDSPNRYARYGACEGLRYAGRGSSKAVDALIHKMENDKDMTLRYFAIEALKLLPEGKRGNGLGEASKRATNELLKLAAEYDPEQDPMRKLARQISFVLFSTSWKAPGFFAGHRNSLTQAVNKADKALLIPAIKAMLVNPNSEARGNAMRAAHELSAEELNQIWGEIYEATTVPAPSGVMFADQTHIIGIETMAENKVKEGLEYGYWYTLKKNGWGFAGRKSHGGIDAVLTYGRAAEPYFKDLKLAIPKYLMGAKEQKAKQQLAAARKAPMPEMISIQKYIDNKPEKQYLDWKATANQQEKKHPKESKEPLPTAGEPRVFTDTLGRKITAELQSVYEGEITIKRNDGKVFTVSLNELSQDDRVYAQEWKSKRTAEKALD